VAEEKVLIARAAVAEVQRDVAVQALYDICCMKDLTSAQVHAATVYAKIKVQISRRKP
jgi:hypothetical protein